MSFAWRLFNLQGLEGWRHAWDLAISSFFLCSYPSLVSPLALPCSFTPSSLPLTTLCTGFALFGSLPSALPHPHLCLWVFCVRKENPVKDIFYIYIIYIYTMRLSSDIWPPPTFPLIRGFHRPFWSLLPTPTAEGGTSPPHPLPWGGLFSVHHFSRLLFFPSFPGHLDILPFYICFLLFL